MAGNRKLLERFAGPVPAELFLALHSLLLLFWMLPEIQHASIYYNDAISHIAIIRKMDEVWGNGGNILDFWMANINLGHPLPRSYQFFAHLFAWAMHRTAFSPLPLETAFNACTALAVLALPWSAFKGARLLGLDKAQAAIAGIAITLFSEKTGYGIGLTNFTFSGFGIYTQLYAFVFFPLAAGFFHSGIRSGRGLLRASVFFALTLFSHVLIGYFAAIWLFIDAMAFLAASAFARGPNAHPAPTKTALLKIFARRSVLFAFFTLAWTAFWLIPLVADAAWQHRSAWEALDKFTGLGAAEIARSLLDGALIDWGRLPVLSALALMGFFLSLAIHRCLALQAAAWFALSFGPSTWGFLEALPFSAHIHWHRAFALMEFAAALCIGTAAGTIASLVRKKVPSHRWGLAACLGLAAAALAPSIVERNHYFRSTNAYWLLETEDSWNRNSAYRELLRFAEGLSASRINAGTHPNIARSAFGAGGGSGWGNELKATRYIPAYGLLAQFNVEAVGPVYHHQNHTEDVAFRHDWRNSAHNRLLNVGHVILPESLLSDSRFMEFFPKEFKEERRFGDAVVFSTGIAESYFELARPFPADAFSENKAELPCADNAALVRSTLEYLHSPLLQKRVFPAFNVNRACEDYGGLETKIRLASGKNFDPPLGAISASGRKPGESSDLYWADGESGDEQILVFKMNDHPNWVVRVNGAVARKKTVSPAFIGVPVGKGAFHVEARYEPGKDRLWLFLATLALLAVCISLRGRPALRHVW